MDTITEKDIRDLEALRDMLVRMSENVTRWGGNGITYPEEIALLGKVISVLESKP